MGRRASYLMVAAFLFAATNVANAADGAKTGQTMLQNAKGDNVGVAKLTDTPHGVLIEVEFAGMPPGAHAFHIHEVGKCEPPFTSAGGHFNPGMKHHGFESPEGYHGGDLPNVVIPDSGSAKVQAFVAGVRLTSGSAKLFDEDGSALVVHAGPDDYKSDPAGAAGDRIACGVVKPLEGVSAQDVELSSP